ncbi:hypothetical protein FACS189430_11680 [Bacteroidia bacterium]|nr:hypothetical protein FACS189430_11680 [Bacteroidia bacterium]
MATSVKTRKTVKPAAKRDANGRFVAAAKPAAKKKTAGVAGTDDQYMLWSVKRDSNGRFVNSVIATNTTNRIVFEHNKITKMLLSFFVFYDPDNKQYIAYCPSLDTTAAGYTIKEAQSEFFEIIQLQFEELIETKNLLNVLSDYGWEIDSNTMSPPSFEEMLQNNDILKDIILHRDFQKITSDFA